MTYKTGKFIIAFRGLFRRKSFIVFQFPIVDFRLLINDNYKIPFPLWPNPGEKEFVKLTGITIISFRK
jgi:hypothetical protein